MSGRPGGAEESERAHLLWQHLEVVHAVTYFAPEVDQALRGLGLKGFWMGYFAARAAAMGAVGAPVVQATFFNFHPAKVDRQIPAAWAIASPAQIRATRDAAVARALRSSLVDVDVATLDEAATLSIRAARAVTGEGRLLAAAHRALPVPEAPADRLWWAASVLREHRGDGHVALLTAAGLGGCEAHVLQAATGRVPAATLQGARGWSDDDWAAAQRRLVDRGLVAGDGRATDDGAACREHIEQQTDVLSLPPYLCLDASEQVRLLTLLAPISDAVLAGTPIPFPNPIGLARPPSTGAPAPSSRDDAGG